MAAVLLLAAIASAVAVGGHPPMVRTAAVAAPVLGPGATPTRPPATVTAVPIPPTPTAGQPTVGATSPAAPGTGAPDTEAPPDLVPANPGITLPPLAPQNPGPSAAPTQDPNNGGGGDPGIFDVVGQVKKAITGWFSDLVSGAISPILDLLGRTVLASPDVTTMPRVSQLWTTMVIIANTLYVLFVLVGAVIVMTHETLQTRYSLKEIAPRWLLGMVASNISLGLISWGITLTNALCQAFLGGVDPRQAATALGAMVTSGLSNAGIFVILMGLGVAVISVVVLATYVFRVAVLVLITVAAPLGLICHALPQTEGAARFIWRAIGGCLLIQAGQALILVTIINVYLDPNAIAIFGLPSLTGLVDMLLAGSLLYLMVKLPFWVRRMVFTSSGRSTIGRIVRSAATYKLMNASGLNAWRRGDTHPPGNAAASAAGTSPPRRPGGGRPRAAGASPITASKDTRMGTPTRSDPNATHHPANGDSPSSTPRDIGASPSAPRRAGMAGGWPGPGEATRHTPRVARWVAPTEETRRHPRRGTSSMTAGQRPDESPPRSSAAASLVPRRTGMAGGWPAPGEATRHAPWVGRPATPTGHTRHPGRLPAGANPPQPRPLPPRRPPTGDGQ